VRHPNGRHHGRGKLAAELGLEKYEAVFRDNEIEVDVLPELTEPDLEKLGLPLGPRKRLLKAIATLGVEPKSTGLSPVSTDIAERRQVTVMFSDLVGSTAPSARMDPEDLREVISAYQKCVTETVGRLGGFIAKFMGDGVLVYFGYPHAHEDDAERAVCAGLKLIAAVSDLKTHAALQTRIGIATGLVVVGDLIDSGGRACRMLQNRTVWSLLRVITGGPDRSSEIPQTVPMDACSANSAAIEGRTPLERTTTVYVGV
jgi:hypothetical protein